MWNKNDMPGALFMTVDVPVTDGYVNRGACLLFHSDCDWCTVSGIYVTMTMVGSGNNRQDCGALSILAVSVNGAAWYTGACLAFTKLFIRG